MREGWAIKSLYTSVLSSNSAPILAASSFFGFAPSQALVEHFFKFARFFGRAKRLINFKQWAFVFLLGFARLFEVGYDFVHRFLPLFRRLKQRNGVAVGFGHFAPIQPHQQLHVFINRRFGQHENFFAKAVVKALGDIARHFNVLDLVASHGHAVGFEHEDVGGHQDGVAV